MSGEQVEQLTGGVEGLERALEETSLEGLKVRTTALEGQLTVLGGTFFPKRFWAENVEVFIVSALLAIGVRFFFLHPFQIPTNSMYPTYSGMQSLVYTEAAPRPGFVGDLWQRIRNWRKSYTVKSPGAGMLKIPVFGPDDPRSGTGLVRYTLVRRFTPLPSIERHYQLYVNDKLIDLYLPRDFSLDEILHDALFAENTRSFQEFYRSQIINNRYDVNSQEVCLHTDIYPKENAVLMDFDILSGDILFVDRFSYHFKKPNLGDPIVFRTDTMETLNDRPAEYFIKRLVGLPGDTLQVKSPVLYRNGAPISGNAAFEANAQQLPGFRGYSERGRLAKGLKERIPKNHYYGMGDNSYESGDSRSFGPIPEKALVGRAFFIYYPISSRWGKCR